MFLTFRTLVLTVLIYVVLLGAFGLLGVKLLNWSKYHHLAESAVRTVGHVTAKEPENHRAIRYSFKLHDLSFHGIGRAGGENPAFDELQVGSEVVIYYDPQNPESSFLGDPREQAADMTTGVLFITLLGSIGSMITLYIKKWLPIFRK
ncbi:MAG TPA: DUF3592 domain-containing protein [Pyrinomonadaceae bacterium]|nr:DUF3592 domain-containing protein [Pyrinomonadaceae bacterium]